VDAVNRARDQLAACHQTSTITAYVTAFRELCVILKDHETPDSLLHKFISGLSEGVQKTLSVAHLPTLDLAIAAALKWEAAATHIAARRSTPTSSTPHNPNRTNHRLNAAHTLTTPVVKTRLTPELRLQLAAEGRCFYCRQPGHLAAACPDRPARPDRYVQSGNAAPQ
jgi:hypothetical protein